MLRAGDFSESTDMEVRGMEKVLSQLRDLVALYRRSMQTEATKGSADIAASRRRTADSAAVGMRAGAGAAGAAAAAAQSQEAFGASLAMSLNTPAWIEQRFQRQLATCACQLWALMNLVQPRPTRAVKEGLASYTGRSVKQVTDWFTNWRARHWKKIIKDI